jgi:glycosyltransferase involved in cell wall biosynthesis
LAGPISALGTRVEKLKLGRVVSPASVFAVVRKLREWQADLLHTHFMDADLLGFLATRIVGKPMVTHIHNFYFFEKRRHAWRYRLMGGGIKRIISVSEYVRRYVAAATGLKDEKFAVVHNGVDLARFAGYSSSETRKALKVSLGLPPEAMVVGNVSRLLQGKGHDIFIKSAAMVLKKYPLARFLIVGEGPMESDLKSLARQQGVFDKIVFAGLRPDVPELLATMDVFVFPSRMDAFGLCLVEAMAAGCPVVAADTCAIPEIIHDGVEGFLFPAKDVETLADKILRLLSDKALAEQCASRALERAKEFDGPTMTRKIEAIYDEILQRG